MQADEWNFRLGTLAHILIAANSDAQHRSEVPKWHEIFPPASTRYQNALAEREPSSSFTLQEIPPAVAGKLLDGFALRQKEVAKKRRGRRTGRKLSNAE